MAKAAQDILDALWRAIENTPLAGIDRDHAQREFERIQHEHSTKPERQHRKREFIYGQMLNDPQIIADLGVTRKHVETLKKREGALIEHYDRIRAARGQTPPPLTPHVARQSQILDVLLSGRSPDILPAETLAAVFLLAAQFVFGRMNASQATRVVTRYRKRFVTHLFVGAGTMTAKQI